jgi:hypothetical protein
VCPCPVEEEFEAFFIAVILELVIPCRQYLVVYPLRRVCWIGLAQDVVSSKKTGSSLLLMLA